MEKVSLERIRDHYVEFHLDRKQADFNGEGEMRKAAGYILVGSARPPNKTPLGLKRCRKGGWHHLITSFISGELSRSGEGRWFTPEYKPRVVVRRGFSPKQTRDGRNSLMSSYTLKVRGVPNDEGAMARRHFGLESLDGLQLGRL